jgi:S-DNA-T family DNA segregation ATPase FtsK/SpoIIIE
MTIYGPGEPLPGDGGREMVPASDPGRVPQRGPDEAVVYLPAAVSRNGVVRKPLIAPWLRSAEHRRAAARWAWLHSTHHTAFHTLRLPMYGWRSVKYTPRGAWRLARELRRWCLDAEGHPLRLDAVDKRDPASYLRLSRQRKERARLRLAVVLAAGIAGFIGVAVADLEWGDAKWAAAAAAVAALGYLGRSLDRPYLDEPVLSQPGAARLTADVVVRALGSLGIAGINQALSHGEPVSFAGPVHRDGPGWRAEVDLPYGVTAVDVIERRDRLASGLRRPLGCVWPEPVHDQHAGRLVMWVGDTDLSGGRPVPHPLAKAGTTSIFRPLPYGTDQRGRPVDVELIFSNVLIGSIPRRGKTMAARILCLGAALDVTAELHVWELKGTGDLDSIGLVAHRYGSGVDEANIAACVTDLKAVYEDLPRRASVLRGLPKELRPENKVTPELARRKSLGLHPVVVVIDEAQELPWKEAEELCLGIIKRGPALGVMLILATQRPDKDSLPTGVSANAGVRFCLQVMGQVENDMILGTGAYKRGLRATTFTKKDRGVGYLVGAADEPQVTRTYYADDPAAELIARRARAAREAAGRLTGYAAGQQDEAAPDVSLLADIAAVMGGEDRVWSEVICRRLAELRPGIYSGWTAEQLGKALAVYGVVSVQMWGSDPSGKGRNRQGIVLEHVSALLTASGSRP